MKHTAIVLAAGSGRRMGLSTQKQFLEIEGYPIVFYSLYQFEIHPNIDEIILVTSKENIEYCKKEIVEKYGFQKIKKVIAGGSERYLSVYEGLLACQDTEYVLIHDGARPFLTEEVISRCITGVQTYKACIVGVPVKDTVKIIDDQGFVKNTPERKNLYNIQTPQTFSYGLLKESYDKILSDGVENVTDDAMVVEYANPCKIKVLEGDYLNIKVTTIDDLTAYEKIFKKNSKKVLTLY